jgi:hypothetical protein
MFSWAVVIFFVSSKENALIVSKLTADFNDNHDLRFSQRWRSCCNFMG